jgi:hypothetical protein
MKRLAITLWALLCSASAATAQDHLEPLTNALSGGWDSHDYNALLLSAFKESFDQNVRARVIAQTPMTGSDLAIGIKEDAGTFRIFALRSETWLWLHTEAGKAQAQQYRADIPPIKIDRCEIVIDPGLAARLIEVWKQMLLRTRYYDTPQWGYDGTWFYFSMPLGVQNLAGRTWTPRYGSLRLLTDITATMNELCTTKERQYVDRLQQQAAALLAQLQ